ncbi:MAG: hypothetical protein JNJ58_09610 [Chitinophagaceae bacterium]|nr:hypothetical protein [Chitinophagaceae bacterium]
MMRLLSSVLFLLVWISSCQNSPESASASKLPKGPDHQYLDKLHRVDSNKVLLSDGCIVLRTGNDVISSMFAQLNKTDKTFSHCGIAFRENNRWMVYHSIGGEDNPDEKLRLDTYEQFVRPDHNLGFGICRYNLNPAQIEKLHQIVLDFHHRQIPFDMEFDLATDQRLYCAEMIYKAFHQALAPDTLFEVTQHKAFRYVSTDNIFVNKDAHLLCRIVY